MAIRNNGIIKEMHGMLTRFASSVKANGEKKAANLRTYQEQLAAKYNDELTAALDNEYTKTRKALDALNEKTQGKIDAWAKIDPNKINADKVLLENPVSNLFDLSESELQEIADRNRDNATMLRMIEHFIEEQKAGQRPVISIVTPLKKHEVYAKFYNSACSLLDSIYNGNASPLELEAWGEESDFSEPLYSIIGDGKELNA